MGFRYRTEGENSLNVWVPAALLPGNAVPVTSNKVKVKRATKRQGAKLGAPAAMGPIPPIASVESPIIDLPLFLPIPLPPRISSEPQHSSILERIDLSKERGGTPPDAPKRSTQQLDPIMDLTSEDWSKPKVKSDRYRCFPPVIDLTVEDSSAHAESSSMASQRRNRKGRLNSGGHDTIDISD